LPWWQTSAADAGIPPAANPLMPMAAANAALANIFGNFIIMPSPDWLRPPPLNIHAEALGVNHAPCAIVMVRGTFLVTTHKVAKSSWQRAEYRIHPAFSFMQRHGLTAFLPYPFFRRCCACKE
jgi:hypothetical protein